MKKTLLAGAALLATLGTASAAEFYVVQDTSNKQCRIVEQKPTGTSTVVIGGDTRVYATRAEAETALKGASACSTDTAQRPAPGTNMAQRPATGGDAHAMSAVPANSVTVTNYHKQNVYDPGNNKIGEIDDTLISSNDGKISALVIGVGGFLGMGEKHVLVPFTAVKGSMKDNKWTLVMNASKDELKAAPGFKYDRAKTTWIKDEPGTTGAR